MLLSRFVRIWATAVKLMLLVRIENALLDALMSELSWVCMAPRMVLASVRLMAVDAFASSCPAFAKLTRFSNAPMSDPSDPFLRVDTNSESKLSVVLVALLQTDEL